MKYVRVIAIWMLAVVLGCMPALAEETADGGERAFPGVAEETPKDVILSAMEIYSWFTISPLDVDPELAGGDGSVYRVADEMLCSHDTMTRLLDFTFCPEIVQEMFSYGTYTVIDGMLYGQSGGRPIDPLISGVTYEETERSEERVVYAVTVSYQTEGGIVMEPQVLEFVREPVGGLWVFTQFPFFW